MLSLNVFIQLLITISLLVQRVTQLLKKRKEKKNINFIHNYNSAASSKSKTINKIKIVD